MLIIPVHRLTRQTIVTDYGSDQIRIDASFPLLPHMVVKPYVHKAHMKAELHIQGPSSLLASIRVDAGHNLFRAHMQQLIAWIDRHVQKEEQAWTAMMRYYELIGLDIDDLPPDTVYKAWQRHESRRKSKKYLYNPRQDVLKNISPSKGTLNDGLRTASELLASFPDVCFNFAEDPDPSMIKKVIMYALHERHHWDQIEIGQQFGISQSAVSQHLRSIKAYLKPPLAVPHASPDAVPTSVS